MVHKLFFPLLVFAFLQIHTIPAHGELQSARAIEIQAAFLIKFSSYIKWPKEAFSDPDEPITIGILGRDPFGSTLDNIARSFHANGRDIVIRRFTDPKAFCKSHILFLPNSEIKRIDEITEVLNGHPALLVGNSSGFLDQGGIINFVIIDKKIRFNISRTNSQKTGLEISSKLFSVAHTIK